LAEMERILRKGKEIDPKNQSFIIEFAGTPLWKRGEKIQVYGDYLKHSFGFDVRYNAIDPTQETELITTEDVLILALSTVDRVAKSSNKGRYTGVLLPGGILEELAYIEFYRRAGILKNDEAEPYKNMLLQYREKIGLAIVVLLSPTTSLSEDTIASLHYEKHDQYELLSSLSSKPRRIMNEGNLIELNGCFVDTIREYGGGFNKIHTVDLRDIELPFREEKIGLAFAGGIWTGLAKVYPLPGSFPLREYKPLPKTPLLVQKTD